jgi:hypothetical protein
MKGLLFAVIIAMFGPILAMLVGLLFIGPFLSGTDPKGGGAIDQPIAGSQPSGSVNPPGPTSGGTMSFSSAVALAKAAGVPLDQLATAVAIAMAESGLNPNATNVNTDGSVDRGLWQINSKAHPDISDSSAFNPTSAAQDMMQISNGGTNWNPWVTYQTGAYLQYLPEAEQAIKQLGY